MDELINPDWLSEGRAINAVYLIVIYDAVTELTSPIYVLPGENLEQKRQVYESGTTTVVTVLDI